MRPPDRARPRPAGETDTGPAACNGILADGFAALQLVLLLPALVLGPAQVAQAFGISDRELRRLRRSGRFPEPDLRIGPRTPRWSVAGLRAWVEAGGPSVDRWEAMRAAERLGAAQ